MSPPSLANGALAHPSTMVNPALLIHTCENQFNMPRVFNVLLFLCYKVSKWRWLTIDVPPSSLDLVLRWPLFYLFCSSIVINAVISNSTHHFYGNACTKSGSLRFPSFPVVDWFCLFIYLWVLTFPLENCSEFGNFVITLIYSLRNMRTIKYTKTIWYWGTNINESSLYATCIIQSLTDNWIINYKMVLPYACMHIFQRSKLFSAQARYTRVDTTLCDKVCQWLATGRWFSPDTPVSSTNKTDSHDITEIWLKVALNTITYMKSYLAHSI